ncbi:hypothetical protein [Fimbriiglobus ruber]|uniref:hypothetical protein n=1 Tax=Fimbriiglobus ruber TaxID=1908690 RepID=UPI000B4A9E56|nr:hypothetical protein [Fimbriiglobus ruber]
MPDEGYREADEGDGVDPLLQILDPLTMTLVECDEIPDANGQGFPLGFAGGCFGLPCVPRE